MMSDDAILRSSARQKLAPRLAPSARARRRRNNPLVLVQASAAAACALRVAARVRPLCGRAREALLALKALSHSPFSLSRAPAQSLARQTRMTSCPAGPRPLPPPAPRAG